MAAIKLGSAASVPPECIRFGALAETVFRRYARIRKPRALRVNRSNLRNRILPWFTDRQIADITPHDPTRSDPIRPDRTRQHVQRRFASLRATPSAADRFMPIVSVILEQSEFLGYSPASR